MEVQDDALGDEVDPVAPVIIHSLLHRAAGVIEGIQARPPSPCRRLAWEAEVKEELPQLQQVLWGRWPCGVSNGCCGCGR